MSKITENTLIPISVFAVVAGGIFWLSSLYIQTKANADSLDKIERKQDLYTETLNSIDRRLSVIEYEVKRRK
jgi:hypothetical protein